MKNMIDREPFVTVQQGMSGYFVVKMWYNPEGFWEPYETGTGRYSNEEDALREAKRWAEAEDIKVRYD